MTVPRPADDVWRSSPLLGREALLRTLESRLLIDTRLVIGVDRTLRCQSGVGRSALAKSLVRRLASPFSKLLRLSGRTPEEWVSSLLKLAAELPIRQRVFRRVADLTAAIRNWLHQNDHWQLLIDAAPVDDLLAEVIGGVTTGLIVIVPLSLNGSETESEFSSVPLGGVAPEDALEILQHSCGRSWLNTEEVKLATQLVLALERNPLCLELAGRILQSSETPLAVLLTDVQCDLSRNPLEACVDHLRASLTANSRELLAAAAAWGTDTFRLTDWKAIVNRVPAGEAADAQLRGCGLLRQDVDEETLTLVAGDILRQRLSRDEMVRGISLAASILPKSSPGDRLSELVCGVIERDADPFAIHRVSLGRLVVDIPQWNNALGTLLRDAADAAIDLLQPELSRKFLLQTREREKSSGMRDESSLDTLISLGCACSLNDQFQEARKHWRQAAEICSPNEPRLPLILLAIAEIDVNENRMDRAAGRLLRVTEMCSPLPITPLNQLLRAQCHFLKGGVALGLQQTDKARLRFRESLHSREEYLAEDHPVQMRNRLMWARTEFLLKDYATSERILLQEVNIREKSPRVSDTELSVACHFLAEQYYLNGRLSDAEPVYERVMELRRATLPTGHRLIGELANRLAVIKSARGAYKESDVLFRESLANLERTYGAEHPEVARVLNDLAESLISQNKIDPARRLLERALHLQEKSLRANDVRLGRTRCNLAAVYVARGRFVEAIRLYEWDVTQRQSNKIPDKAALATSLNNLAEALRSVGRHVEAEQKLLQALSLREELVGSEHPLIAQVLNNLGYLYLQLHRFADASHHLERALRIRERCLSPNHPHLATTLATLAEVHFTQGEYERARPYYTRSIEIALAAYGERHPQVATFQICSARNELRLGHIGRAELMFLRGKITIEEVLGADHRMSAKVLLGMSELAHFEKRYEAAFPWLERCLTIQMATMSSMRLEIAETLCAIADNLVARGLHAEALPRVVEAVELQQRVLGETHPEVLPNMDRIGRIQQSLGHAAEAEEAYRFVLSQIDPTKSASLERSVRDRLPDVLIPQAKYTEAASCLHQKVTQLESRGDSLELLGTLSQLAGVHYLRSVPADALPLMERCVILSEKLCGPESVETAKHLDNLAGVRFLLGDYDSAEAAVQKSIVILEQAQPPQPGPLAKARENYLQLLRQTNRAPEADKLESTLSPVPVESELVGLPSSHVLDDL